jgi:type VI secretion system protein ImpL
VARERLGANIVSLLADAQSFEAFPDGRSAASLERRLRRRVAAFEAAAEPISQILGLLDELGLWQTREDLSDLVVQQGGRLLSQVDHLLRTRDPYAPRQGGFGWWDGTVPAGLTAFDAANPEELTGYLQVQRQRLEGIARDYAEPLVTWLEQTGAASDPSVRSLVARWDGILAALDAHAGQKPGNSVGRLEEFIGQEIAELTLEGCFVALPASATNARGDYFLESRERLRAELLTRCRSLAADRAADSYAELSNLFNRRLAGRYPFADDPDAAYTAEAAPDDVESFFRRFDLSAPMIREAGSAEGTSTPGLPRAALDFMDEMTRVRRFFAPFLDAEEQPPAPLYDVEVEFRVNRAAEVGGSQIIEWALEVGRERISNRSETLRTRWSPGEPVRLTLRWAADSPREPVSPSVPEVRSWSAVEGRTVTYEFRNRWSLLSALDVLRARPRDVEAYASLDPGTLYLAIDTRRAGSERVDPEPAEVYVRLSVLPPDGVESLTVPRFPARAPSLRGRGGEAL